MLKLFLAFTLIPALEIFLFIRIGGAIGFLNTLLVVILTG
ncbi:MAG: FxsA family protein, partial [Deltaproteobacteria bacterium]|nr:FxsA family protein [Deltaproteobacteria bacterium]